MCWLGIRGWHALEVLLRYLFKNEAAPDGAGKRTTVSGSGYQRRECCEIFSFSLNFNFNFNFNCNLSLRVNVNFKVGVY